MPDSRFRPLRTERRGPTDILKQGGGLIRLALSLVEIRQVELRLCNPRLVRAALHQSL
jgi:hypothetical protein